MPPVNATLSRALPTAFLAGLAGFAGMIGVTIAGLILTPVFYVALRTVTRRMKRELVPEA